MKIRNILLLAGAILLLMFSCENPINEIRDTNQAAEETAPEGTSKVSISFPSVSSAFTNTLAEKMNLPSRAYFFVKNAEVILTDSDSNNRTIGTFSIADPNADEPGEMIEMDFYVPWGTGYTISVIVYDGIGTAPENVVVSGTSDPFDVGFTTPSVSVVLIPQNPVSLLQNTDTAGTMISTGFNSVTGSITSLGDELWYNFSPASDGDYLIELSTDISDGVYTSGALIFADINNSILEFTASLNPMESAYIILQDLIDSETYYAGVGLVSDGAYSDSYSLYYSELTNGILSVSIVDLADSHDGETLYMSITPENGDPMTDQVAFGSGEFSDQISGCTAIDSATGKIWKGTGNYDVFLFIDSDEDGNLTAGENVYSNTVSLTTGLNELNIDTGDFVTYNLNLFRLGAEYDPKYDQTIIKGAIFPGGTSENDIRNGIVAPLAAGSAYMDGGPVTFDVYDYTTNEIWYETGDYDFVLFGDTDNNDTIDSGEYSIFFPYTITEPITLIMSAIAFTSDNYVPNLEGVWYDLQDDREVILFFDAAGKYHYYERRHDQLSSDYFEYLNEDIFYELERGSYSLFDNQLVMTIEELDFFTDLILEEWDGDENPATSTEEDLINLGLTLSGVDSDLILMNNAALSVYLLDTNGGPYTQAEIDNDIFSTEIITISYDAYVDSNNDPGLSLRFNTDEDLYKKTHLDTDIDSGDQAFRSPIADSDLPAAVNAYLNP